MTLRALSHADIAASATLRDLIPAIAAAMRQVSERRVEMPLRFVVPLQPGAGFGVMTGAMAGVGHGAKLLTLMRREKGSSHTGALILFDAETGEPVAIMDSGLPTAMRTAAASAVATDALARKDAATLAILGAGEQAEWHIEAMRAVRPIRGIRVWARSPAKAASFAATHGARAAASVDEACDGADIVCTVTGAATPILHAAQLPAGVHVNAVGASLPSLQEIAPDCHGACRTVVDYRPSAEAQAGELIAARAAGIVPAEKELPEIGEVLSGKAPGRASPRERTLYRSLGIIAQDLAAAHFLLHRAEAAGRGTVLDLYA
ncbi:MAG TPA: ornithine cyclodeaminase family protein [Stellaceae bacterium]|nr:ornithine cyclodeaminase family protein [Stellaceae bacterium]